MKKAIIIAALVLFGSGGALAQSEAGMAARAAAQQAARDKAVTQDLKAAVKEIEKGLKSTNGSAGWHVEKAIQLLHLGLHERDEGRADNAVALGNQALRELVKAEKKPVRGDGSLRLTIKAVAETILENLSGDSTLARLVRIEQRKERGPGKGRDLEELILIPGGEI